MFIIVMTNIKYDLSPNIFKQTKGHQFHKAKGQNIQSFTGLHQQQRPQNLQKKLHKKTHRVFLFLRRSKVKRGGGWNIQSFTGLPLLITIYSSPTDLFCNSGKGLAFDQPPFTSTLNAEIFVLAMFWPVSVDIVHCWLVWKQIFPVCLFSNNKLHRRYVCCGSTALADWSAPSSWSTSSNCQDWWAHTKDGNLKTKWCVVIDDGSDTEGPRRKQGGW